MTVTTLDWKDFSGTQTQRVPRMRWWVVVAMLVLMVEARRRKPGGTCGLSCYRSLLKKAL